MEFERRVMSAMAALMWVGDRLEREGDSVVGDILDERLRVRDVMLLARLVFNHEPGTATPGDFVPLVYSTSAGVSGCLNRLEEAQFITRSKDPDDGRVVRITVTEDGQTRALASLLPWYEWSMSKFAGLDESELLDLHRLLTKGFADPETFPEDWAAIEG